MSLTTKAYAVFALFVSVIGMAWVFDLPSIVLILDVVGCGALSYIIRCPKCGKRVVVREGRIFRYALPWPETVCSRCGAQLSSTASSPNRCQK